MSLKITPLTAHIGARIDGVDAAAPIEEGDASRLRQALVDHLVLVFADQSLDEDAQVQFCSLFGSVGQHLRPGAIRTEQDNANPAVMMVTNARADGKPVGYLPDGEIMFHTDSCFHETPQRAVSLYGIEVTETGGETTFLNACRLYDTLPRDLQEILRGRAAINTYEFGVTIKQVAKFDRSKWPHARHPLLVRDQRDGRIYLYANELMTEEIDGLSADDNRTVLDRIFDHIRRSPDRYVHRWTEGDLVIWDNRRTLHARADFPADQPRCLRRVPVDDDVPVIDAFPATVKAVP